LPRVLHTAFIELSVPLIRPRKVLQIVFSIKPHTLNLQTGYFKLQYINTANISGYTVCVSYIHNSS